MANSNFYTQTKEDSRQWRAEQDTVSDALDQAAVASGAALAAKTTALADYGGITVTPATASIAVAGTQQLSAAGVSYLTSPITWSTSNAAKATVNASGLVTGVQAGTAVITATSGTFYGKATITVT